MKTKEKKLQQIIDEINKKHSPEFKDCKIIEKGYSVITVDIKHCPACGKQSCNENCY